MKKFIDKYLIFIIIGIYTSIVILVTLNRFWQYEAFYYDHGIYDMAFWRVSRFQAPIIEHLNVGGKWIFADHFHPAIFLMAPLYWITSRQEIILIGQALAIAVSIFYAYKISLQLIKSRLLRFSLIFSYIGFIGFQNAVIANFHDVTFLVMPLMITFWYLLKKKWTLYWIFLFLTLLCREMTFLIGIGIGLYMFFRREREYKRNGVITIILSFIYGILAIKLITPFFAGQSFIYQPNIPKDIVTGFTSLFLPIIKTKTMLITLLNFGFLPLFVPTLIPAFLQDYIVRFVFNNGEARWDLGLHYNISITPILFLSSALAASKLEKKLGNKLMSIYSVLILLSVTFIHYKLHGPLGLAINPEFYRHTYRQKFMDDFLKDIPNKGLIMAPNNLAVRLTHYNVILLRNNYEYYNPDVIVLDLRDGQNPNNYWPLNSDGINSLKARLLIDENYKNILNDDNRFIFVKK